MYFTEVHVHILTEFSHLSKEKINSGQMMALNNYNVEGLVSNCVDHLEENLTFTNDALNIIISAYL